MTGGKAAEGAHEIDRQLMLRALELAARGHGGTSPNPMVGAVVVRAGEVVGEGWHHRAGRAHAEIEALATCTARGATMYVTLEPCCHQGRTGPCTKALIAAGIARVVIAAPDPNPLVAGKGVAELRAAGIEVETGVCEAQARALNRAFDKWIVTRTPWLTLKLAVSLDGRIAARIGETTAVTGSAVRERVQAMRATADAVMVGRKTVAIDAPRLTVRDLAAVPNPEFLPPWRVIVDSQLRTPIDAAVFGTEPPGAIVATALAQQDARVRALVASGVRVCSLAGPDGRVDLTALLALLGGLAPTPITSILCEGGGVLAASLLAARLVDELVLMVAPKVFGAHGVASVGPLHAAIDGFVLDQIERLGDDVALTYRRPVMLPWGRQGDSRETAITGREGA